VDSEDNSYWFYLLFMTGKFPTHLMEDVCLDPLPLHPDDVMQDESQTEGGADVKPESELPAGLSLPRPSRHLV
jgi:hypothetical protein